jgi:hypothetical protein
MTNGTNTTIQRNRIYNVWGVGTGTGASSNQVYGIYVSNTLGTTVRNNQISIGNNTIGETRVYGIQDIATSGNNAYFNNSIFVNGNISGGSNNSYCLQRTGLVNISSFNNIFYNKRTTSGIGFNFATGSNSLTGISPATTNYNLYLVNDTSRIAESPLGFANSLSIFNTLYTNANTYSSNWYALNTAVSAQTLFIDTLTSNLGIVTTNANSWYVNGKGLALTAVTNDYNDATRSVSIATGATDIGSVEFTTLTTPPSAVASAAPAANTNTTYTFAGRQVASITWGAAGTLPSAVNLIYYTGTNAPNLLVSRTQYNAYYNISAIGGAGYTYGINLIADSATFGNVSGSNTTRIARYTGTTWNLISNSTASGFSGTMQTSTNTQNVFGNFTGTDNSNNPLPVDLISFSAKLVNKDVLLTWATASESNNKGFDVERSEDGVNFEWIAFVKGANNSSKLQSYALENVEAFFNTQGNTLYYRLKQVDNDGSFTFTNVIMVSIEGTKMDEIAVFPNPFTNNFQVIVIAAQNETITIETIDLQSKIVASKTITMTADGLNKLETDNLSHLQAGIYFAHITYNGLKQVKKIVKN